MTALHAFELGALSGAVGIYAVKYVATKGWNAVLTGLKTKLDALDAAVKS